MNIDDIANSLPNGFHDSEILNINLNFDCQKATILMNINLCDPDVEVEVPFRGGCLHLSGLLLFVLEPPGPFLKLPGQSFAHDYIPSSDKLWITADSSDFSSLETYPELPEHLPEKAFKHWFFNSNNNNFIYLAAMDASFEWTNSNEDKLS
jgi:hypothetical protein